ncbi:nuclear transport factor 2 family protein [Eisenibacter elegans]|jgi:hypothetical protein|uniref:nuclear transport factor 2 family protein n=1 Tax=Eisenibacter elegans TaxID=997 RepID=UPI000400617E|nr:nuclear transport factor 2 family protein [Eisenibacter elegans]
MNKTLLLVLLSLSCSLGLLQAQHQASTEERRAIQELIDQLFEAMHSRDTAALKTVFYPSALMQSINAEATLSPIQNYEAFVNNIAAVPKSTKIEERLMGYSIWVDGSMATAWTPYEFYVNDTFSHCGVNAFQLLHTAQGWKIIYIVDTRRPKDCSQ